MFDDKNRNRNRNAGVLCMRLHYNFHFIVGNVSLQSVEIANDFCFVFSDSFFCVQDNTYYGRVHPVRSFLDDTFACDERTKAGRRYFCHP